MSESSPGVEEYVQRGVEIAAQHQARIDEMRTKRFDTIAVHGLYGAQAAGANQNSILEPVYMSPAEHFENSSHLEAALGYQMPSWGYSRIANPTIGYLEATISLLEGYGFDGSVDTMATSSGMSAVFMATAPFLSAEPGTDMNFVTSVRLYGGTYQLFSQRYVVDRGIDGRWVGDNLDLSEWESKIDDNTRFLYTESPSNPGLAIADLKALSALADKYSIPLIVDNTIASPALTRPFLRGADIVVESLSKIMGASGMAIAGSVSARHRIRSRAFSGEMVDNFAIWAKLWPGRDFGPCVSPMNAMMVLNDLRSLTTRVERTSDSAMAVAEFLESHAGVESVTYPGLASMAGHEVAARQMSLVDSTKAGFGAMLSFDVAGGEVAARRVFDRFQMIWRATDLGRVKTVATMPAISTHQQQGEEARDAAGVPSNMIRVSVGMEHVDDVIADLDQALAS